MLIVGMLTLVLAKVELGILEREMVRKPVEVVCDIECDIVCDIEAEAAPERLLLEVLKD